MKSRVSISLLVALALALAALSSAAQYAPGDVIVTDQNSSFPSSWPLWGITPQGKVYTVSTSLSFYAWSVAPAPDNRTLWASGKGIQGLTTATIAPDGTITNFHIDFNHLFTCIDVDSAGDAILGNLVNPSINKFSLVSPSTIYTLSTLYSGPPFSSIQGGGIDLATGDFVVVDSNGPNIYQVSLFPRPSVSTVIARIGGIGNGLGLHADPGTGTMVGSWGSGIYRLVPGSPGILTTLKTGVGLGTLAALDRDPWDGQFVIPSWSTTSTQPAVVLRFDAASGAITTLAQLPAIHRVMPMAATVAGSRHLCATGAALPGKTFSMMVSSPNEPRAFYAVAVSLSVGPGIPVGGGRRVFLTPDDLFHYSLTNSGIFSGFQGVLGGGGEAIAKMSIPSVGALSGLRFFAAVVTIQQNQISVISDPLGVTIQ
ncbi:MAG: hypothetical protein JXQ29_14815 [Planctomycetes bacterium]|nr:hypothetical protein [Planctomycetota bacterium]